ncbi:MAG: DUF3990 domain-containing protein [Bacteroidales bacterium]|nr:DUF3990 domain-containing protein [Candidatus Cryptobacteroides choladohippi]
MKVYHGSNVIVDKPRVLTDGHTKDFGFGFYCTSYEQQAIKWALAKRGKHIVNEYELGDVSSLNVKTFDGMSEEWLDFVAACRKGSRHDFDIVEGPMADDTIWNYVEDFVSGNISREAFWALARFKYPTHQIVFCSDRALATLSFIDSRNEQ